MQRTVEFSEIARQHEELKQIINHLQAAATRKSSKLSGERRRAVLLDEVALLRASLVEHFRMEEEGGDLEAVTAAGKGRSVARLELQHVEILDALEHIVETCRRGGALDQATAAVCHVISRLREHEDEECRLMQDAVIDDIGVGD